MCQRILQPTSCPRFVTRLMLVLAVVVSTIMTGSCWAKESTCCRAAAKKTAVIFDTDICDDIDDTWALSLLLQSPELDVKLITTEVGNTPAKARTVAKFLAAVGRTDIPIGIGIQHDNRSHWQAGWSSDYDLERYPGKVYKDGVAALIDTIMKSKQPIKLIAVGPLPNIAEALKREPRIAEKVQFVGMHGSVRRGYRGRPNPDPEYNVRAFVKASQTVFTAKWDMIITPLDTCGIVHLTGAKYKKIVQRNSALTKALLENYRVWYRQMLLARNKDISPNELKAQVDKKLSSSSTTLFDTVGVYLAFSTDLVKVEKLPILVTDDGYTRIDPKGKKIRCATEWKDLAAFEDLLVERLTR